MIDLKNILGDDRTLIEIGGDKGASDADDLHAVLIRFLQSDTSFKKVVVPALGDEAAQFRQVARCKSNQLRDHIDNETERAELFFLALAVTLAQLSTFAMKHGACERVTGSRALIKSL